MGGRFELPPHSRVPDRWPASGGSIAFSFLPLFDTLNEP